MDIRKGFSGSVGNTPLIKLNHASEKTGCTILGKAEFLNPGQSVKDRAALFIVEDAIRGGTLGPGGIIVEGTAGNTGIGLALLGNSLGYRSVIVIPDTQSREKKDMLRLAGAELVEVPAAPYKNPNNYIRYSSRLADAIDRSHPAGAIWANQFDNLANQRAHTETTAQEIWQQTDGRVDGFCCAVGTGGTIGGVSIALKEKNAAIRTAVADPPGSAIYNYYKNGELKSEGSSITEGIGQGRITENLAGALVDDAYFISDEVTVQTIYDLLRHDGLCLGGSSGVNVAGAIRMAEDMGPGHTIVTMLCDYGTRYQSKIFNPDYLRERHLPPPDWLEGAGAMALPEVYEYVA